MKRSGRCTITQADFIAFYPQFAGFSPEPVLAAYVAQANGRFSSFSPPDAEDARRLYTAHRLTLYARTALPAGAAPSMAVLAAAGERKTVAAKKVGEVSVTYATGASSSVSASADLADLPETSYGLQLLSLLRLYGRSVYVR